MSEKPVASIKTLARYEPDTVYIGTGEYVAECVRADDGDYYLAADVDAAIEALRAEVERLKSMTAVTMGIGSGDGSLFVHGDYDSIKAAQALVFRAERLEEALRDAEKSLRTIADRAGGTEYLMTIGDVRGYANSRANEARAALDGEWE